MLIWFHLMTMQRVKSALFGTLLLCTIPAVAIDSVDYIERSVELIQDSKHSLARTYLNPAIIDYRLSAAARSRAYYLRGYSYFAQGLYVSAGKDYHRALEFNPGNPGALAALGDLYFRGRGVQADQALAFTLFETAAQVGHPGAMVQVGYAYLEGAGVEPDLEAARKWLTDAADAGNTMAMAYLARSYREPYTDTPDPESARDWYLRAEAGGSRDAIVALAYMHQNGEFGEADPVRAAELFAEAAEEGSSNASVSLAHLYLTGIGVDADPARAKSLFESAADAGNPAAFLGLAHLYESGLGASEDLDMAIEFYEQAAAADLVPAQLRLAYLNLARDNVSDALNWLARAAALDRMEAHNDYAWILATTPEDTLRNGELALIHAEKAVGMKASASYLDTLAAAYAELGRFEEAISTQQDAIAAVDAEDDELRAELQRHLEAYKAGEPWRE
jgi:TPR repeat protein